MSNLAMSAALGLDSFEVPPLELRSNWTESDLHTIIRGVYKQVLGNEHLMDSQHLESAEALLRDGALNVREFVRVVAQSSLYQSLFFHGSSQYRFIELNFKHLLGRPPQDEAEIIEHVKLYYEQGYEAEIDSYIDSDEYILSFGGDIVPYPRSIITKRGNKTESFNRMFSLLRGPATHDRDNQAKLITSLASNSATPIKKPAVGNGANYGSTSKRYRIAFSSSNTYAQMGRLSKQEYVTSFSQMSTIYKKIHQLGGKILSITEEV